MIELTEDAEQQVYALQQHYLKKERFEAARNLRAALFDVSNRIERDPAAGLPAPTPYPQLARHRRLWRKEGRYWFAYRTTPTLAITAVFYDTANIPKRL